jgi:hypothetical protein
MSTVTPPHRTAGRLIPWREGNEALGPHRSPDARSGKVHGRRRLIALVAGAVVLVCAIAAGLMALAGSGEVPPATGAAQVVPADALAYVHLSTDSSRSAVTQAEQLGRRFPDYPLLAGSVLNRLDALIGGSGSVDFATEIRPWLGKEAAFALLGTSSGSTAPLLVLGVAQPARAQRFLTKSGASSAGAYDGIRLERYASGTELAFVRHYLVAGPAGAVQAAIGAGRSRARSLASQVAYQRAALGEPADRVLDAYLPATGLRRLLAGHGGALAALGVLFGQPALTGTAISLSATSSGARIQVHSTYNASLRRLSGPAPSSFAPTLQTVLPAGSTLMLDVKGLASAAPRLLQAAAAAGIGANIAPLLGRLGAALAAEGVNVRSVLSLFGGETAVAIGPGGASSPSLIIVSRVRNQAATQASLASLEGPLTALFSNSGSGAGQVPELADRQVAGATVHELGLGPGLQLDYGVFDGLVVVSTSVAGVGDVAERANSLAGQAEYKSVLSGQPKQLSSLLFLDFSQLLRLGEQTGLVSGARLGQLLPDLTHIRAVGLSSTGGERDTTTELGLEIR